MLCPVLVYRVGPGWEAAQVGLPQSVLVYRNPEEIAALHGLELFDYCFLEITEHWSSSVH